MQAHRHFFFVPQQINKLAHMFIVLCEISQGNLNKKSISRIMDSTTNVCITLNSNGHNSIFYISTVSLTSKSNYSTAYTLHPTTLSPFQRYLQHSHPFRGHLSNSKEYCGAPSQWVQGADKTHWSSGGVGERKGGAYEAQYVQLYNCTSNTLKLKMVK